VVVVVVVPGSVVVVVVPGNVVVVVPGNVVVVVVPGSVVVVDVGIVVLVVVVVVDVAIEGVATRTRPVRSPPADAATKAILNFRHGDFRGDVTDLI
jgi:hypothetical protein